MADLPGRISLREVGPRDGLQNEDLVPTDAKIALVDRLSGTGVGRIEAVSFVSPKAIPQMADADDVWRQVHKAAGVRYSALVPNLRGWRPRAGCTGWSASSGPATRTSRSTCTSTTPGAPGWPTC
jgi:hydroxymethylglutaryl-CoA lyase